MRLPHPLRVATWAAALLLALAPSLTPSAPRADAAPAAPAPFTWLRSWSEAQRVAQARGCLILVSSTRPGCTLCEAFRNQVVPACQDELAPLAVGYLYNTDRPEDPRPDRVLRQNLPRARMLPLVGFLTADGAWLHGFWGPRKAGQFRGDLAHVRSLPAARAPRPAPAAALPVPPTASAPAPAPVAAPTPAPRATAAAAAPARPAASAPLAARAPSASAPAAPPAAVPTAPPAAPPAAVPTAVPAPPPAQPSAEPEEENLDELCPNGMCHLDAAGTDAPLPGAIAGLPEALTLDLDRAPPTRSAAVPRNAERGAQPVARAPASRAATPATVVAAPERSVLLTGSPDGPAQPVQAPPRPTPAAAPATPTDPVIAAAREGRFRDAFAAAADWSGARRLALERAAQAWANERLELALFQARAGRHDQALRAVAEVLDQVGGRPEALDAATGRDAIEALRDLRRLRDPEGADAVRLRRQRRDEHAGTRWAQLFEAGVR